MVRDLLRAGLHVQYSCGLQGISTRRMRAVPLGHEPLFYLEPLETSYVRRALKRVVDVVGSSVLLVLSAPLMAVAAVAVKVQDRGPILFRQQRVGLHGQQFQMLKLRTMRPDAEADDALAAPQNDRDGGPLYKNATDPRRTRVGRFLERVSLDELPQLVNVLRGNMSLVGPRPALPAQVEAFDDELLTRHTMRPGVTGLWQLEARDNPSFRAYRRLDLFYVENWSIGLDIAILLGTVGAVLGRRSKP
jgi:lipopolysaccharide/colanic/teichoic acid biosynthesis glycosyltransferase